MQLAEFDLNTLRAVAQIAEHLHVAAVSPAEVAAFKAVGERIRKIRPSDP